MRRAITSYLWKGKRYPADDVRQGNAPPELLASLRKRRMIGEVEEELLSPVEPDDTPATTNPALSAPLTTISGIGEELARVMNERGIMTVADLAETAMSDLVEIPGIAQKMAAKIKAAAVVANQPGTGKR